MPLTQDQEGRLLEIFRTVMEDGSLSLSDATTAADVPGWDSVAHITLMSAIEAEFEVTFDDDDLTRLTDVGALRGFLAEHAAA